MTKLLTPSDVPVETVCRTIKVPNSLEWLGIFNAVLLAGTYPYNWSDDVPGSLTPEAAAEAYSTIFYEYLLAPFECPSGVPTPFWDDATDLDDQEPAGEQQWYGIFDGTFQETVENFVIAGFIAYSGQVGAAITFLTLAPRFRLAWKTGNLGGIIRVIIDGADAGTVDTFAATEGVLEKDYVTDPANTEHSILMVLEDVP